MIFGNLKISLLQVLSIGGRKKCACPPPHAHTTFSLLFDQIRPFSSTRDHQERKIACARTWFWVKNTTEQGCAWGGGMHTFSSPPRRQDDHIRHASKLTSKMTSKLTTYATWLRRHITNLTSWWWSFTPQRASTTSRRPHQARLQIDLQNEFQIDYVCSLTT